ncbi:sensor histidine kinase [Actinomadura sp. WAC 06369]|uniref:sensor histidine kinase n=1 Tax=Actinomadura sp. WAC 06369 TaxID=2203193 RepID=UPI000F7B39D3|nr:sensor histidine kinase [Actinomadura sp. WAC 06369]RSN59933.1 two-component sensor histidine kinase [Actinomadura sp. WAC 06369]
MDARADRSPQSRWDRGWLLAPYPAAAVAALITVLQRPAPPALALTLGLSALVAGWHWWMVTAHPQWPERRAAPMALYFTVQLGLAWVLYVREPVYVVLLAACYPTAFVTLPGRSAYAGVLATSAALALPSALAADWWASPGPLATACGSTVLVCAVGGALRAVESEARRRRLAYDELAAAHARLSELARHNEGLQERLLDRAREAGVLTERTRMARELHDTLAQGLAGILTHLEAADGHVPPGHPAHGHVGVARRTARENLAEARRWMLALRPAPLDGGTLAETIGVVAERWAADNGARATVTATGTPVRLRPDAEETILRAAQEALANVARHARARRVRVTLSFMDDVVALDVLDDGVGFDPDAPPGPSGHGGFGLSAMRHRVTRVAGTLTVESAPGRGTALSVTVPALRPEQEGERE